MQVTITEKSKAAFVAASEKLNLSSELPDLSMLRPDLAHWLTANLMMATIIEADKDGQIYDITDHSKRKYEAWHTAKDGYVPGSGGGFSCHDGGYGRTCSGVGVRLTLNSREECKNNAEEYPDLWEIIKLNVK